MLWSAPIVEFIMEWHFKKISRKFLSSVTNAISTIHHARKSMGKLCQLQLNLSQNFNPFTQTPQLQLDLIQPCKNLHFHHHCTKAGVFLSMNFSRPKTLLAIIHLLPRKKLSRKIPKNKVVTLNHWMEVTLTLAIVVSFMVVI